MPLNLGNNNLAFSWNANNVVNIPILFAMLGFFLSILILKNGCSGTEFHEIYLQNKKELVVKTIEDRIYKLRHLTDSLVSFSNVISKDADSAKKYTNYWKAQKALSNSLNELNNLNNENSDTSLKYFAQYISVNRDTLDAAINSLQKDDETNYKRTINVIIKDTCNALSDSPFFRKDILYLEQKKKDDSISFFNDYALFGFWFFFSIAQMTLWFLLIPLIIGAVKETDIQVSYNFKTGLLFSVIPLLLVGLFAYLFYYDLVDANVIKDAFFFNGYNSKMVWYSIPGYFVAVLCFSSYLFLSNNLELLDVNSTTNPNVQSEYNKLTATFNFTFLCSAIVLSVFVFWVGLLFNAINSTEAMQFYTLQSAKPFLNYDFVYLLGLMHTLLLFIFYIPVRIRFNSLEITQQQQAFVAKNSTASAKIWNGLLDSLSTVLVTTSPLLISLIQKLISMFSS